MTCGSDEGATIQVTSELSLKGMDIQKRSESRHSKKNGHLSARPKIKVNVPISKTLPFLNFFLTNATNAPQ